MARQREFDPNHVLKTAITLFWQNGYCDTSVDQIVRQSGVAKYGIYGTFGSKQELFMTALTQYATERHRDIQRPIRTPGASLPEIRKFFARAVNMMTHNNAPRGCLIANIGVELGTRDPEISTFVARFFQDISDVLAGCLRRAADLGQFAVLPDVAPLASYLTTEFRTALMLAASGSSRRQIRAHLDISLRVLD